MNAQNPPPQPQWQQPQWNLGGNDPQGPMYQGQPHQDNHQDKKPSSKFGLGLVTGVAAALILGGGIFIGATQFGDSKTTQTEDIAESEKSTPSSTSSSGTTFTTPTSSSTRSSSTSTSSTRPSSTTSSTSSRKTSSTPTSSTSSSRSKYDWDWEGVAGTAHFYCIGGEFDQFEYSEDDMIELCTDLAVEAVRQNEDAFAKQSDYSHVGLIADTDFIALLGEPESFMERQGYTTISS